MRLFNRIRRRLLEDLKIRNYFLYAIGEIVLIVIGILIAVQINDRNEHAKNERSEDRILMDLQVLFNTNQNQIDYNIQELQKIRESLILRILTTGPEVEIPDQKTISQLSKIDHTSLKLAYDGIQQKLSQNELSIIGSDELKDEISTFTLTWMRYSNLEEALSNLTLGLRRTHQQYISLVTADSSLMQQAKETGQAQFSSDYLGWIRDRDHQNKAVESKWKTDETLAVLQELRSHNQEIIEILSNEIQRLRPPNNLRQD